MSGAEPIPAPPRRHRASCAAGRRRALAVAAGIAGILGAVPGQAQTLSQALSEAYNSNPQLLAQRALLRATDEQVPQALSFWRPQVTFTGQVGIATASLERAPTPAELAVGSTRSVLHAITRPDVVQFQATQPVYRGGRTVAQTRQAINTVESTRAQTLAVETTVFQAV